MQKRPVQDERRQKIVIKNAGLPAILPGLFGSFAGSRIFSNERMRSRFHPRNSAAQAKISQ
jgi:hypothetical protein